MKIKISLLSFLLSFTLTLYGQGNNECVNSIFIPDVADYCSATSEYNNQTASLSPQANPTCFPQADDKDVWFSFKAVGTEVKIGVVGAAGNNAGGTLQDPQFALYSGDCTNLTEVQCFSDAFNTNVAESLAGGLVPGENYYIRVGARNENTGSFQLCITNFNLVPEPSSDCPTGVVLCDKQAFSIESLSGTGVLNNELSSDDCIQQEFSSAWYKWTCGTAGSLTFKLTPGNPNDDLDFSVYELPNGVEDCSEKILLRCVASGENVGQPFSDWEDCTGATGLSTADNDIAEQPGCANSDNNFAAALNMEVGKSYALIVNNFSNSGFGFNVEFGGTGTFLGPQPDFTINPEEGTQCDFDMVEFSDASVIPAGFVTDYLWLFGEDAVPATANTPGPHNVLYESFGTKTIVLQITTQEGCIVTTVKDIFIESCCPPDADIDIEPVEINNPPCANEPGGSFTVAGAGGFPTYQYSIDNQNFQQGSTFNFVPEGDYQVYIVDKKGCTDSTEISLVDPEPLIVDAGADHIIDLGQTLELNGQLVSFNLPPNPPTWTPPNDIIENAETYTPLLLPLRTTDYILTVQDELGCTAMDTVNVFVNLRRPLFVPNAFSPNDDGVNDLLTVFGNDAVKEVRYLRIFNRWGSLVYESRSFPINTLDLGWDGTYKGQDLGTDVFVYIAEVEFIDGQTVLLKGDVSLIR